MKQLTTVIFLVMASTNLVTGKNDKNNLCFEIGLTPILTNGICIGFTHSFSDRWSVIGESYLWIGNIFNYKSNLEKTHDNEFGDSKHDIKTKEIYMSDIAVRFWPSEVFKSHFISLGMRYGNMSRTDFVLEYGYRIPFSKGFGLSVSVKAGLRALMKKEISHTQLFNIGIGYVF